MSKNEILAISKKLVVKKDTVIILSPIPLLIRELTKLGNAPLFFFNEKRVKKELLDGKIIQVLAKDGWELV